MQVQVSFGLAFVAGLLSFLSPCVLPVVPSYIAFVSGVTLDELRDRGSHAARRAALLHSSLFVVGFALVFMTMGWAATAAGKTLAHALPWLNRIGGVALIVFGLYLAGLLPVRALAREIRVQLSSRPTGLFGSLLVGVAFGAGWTPCIGPILASILLYVGLGTTAVRGTLLLATYALGLGLPFVLASVAFNWFLASTQRIKRWMAPLERVAGILVVIVGVAMVSGSFETLGRLLAGLGQLVNLKGP